MWIYIIIFIGIAVAWILKRKKMISLNISDELFRKVVILICVTDLLAFGTEFTEFMQDDFGDVTKTERDSYGGNVRQESYIVQIGDGEETSVEIQISPRIYEEEQLQTLVEKARKELDKVLLGENTSSEYVTRNLELPTQLEGFPFTITWELSRYDVVNLSGQLIQEEIIENDPDNQGILVTVTGTLAYETEKFQYQTEILVFASEVEETVEASIQSLAEASDESTREDEYLVLPEEWNGQALTWKREKTQSGSYLLMLGVVMSVLFILNEKQKEAERKKARREEMLLDYPEIISQFTMLLGAGMTAKNVWRKLTEDYKRQKAESGRVRAAYEEILYTWQEMQSGIPEAECYERFARRCEILPYMKMGALLAQNLRKGSKGIAEMLTMEAVEAMEERKNRAKRLGEEAGTKLLVPMMIMLIVVLAIVVVPAFWSASM